MISLFFISFTPNMNIGNLSSVKKFTNIYLITAIAIFLVVALYYLQTGLLEGFEEKTYDLRVRTLHRPVAASSAIAIIAIDDKTIAEIGRFPFSRTNYVDLLNVTCSAGA